MQEIEEKLINSLEKQKTLIEKYEMVLTARIASGIEAMAELRQVKTIFCSDNIEKKPDELESTEDDDILINRFQRISIGDLTGSAKEVLNSEKIYLNQSLTGRLIKESDVIKELKSGNDVHYSKKYNVFYRIIVEEV
ncbi:hypothetical protein [Methanococcus maripaludis]|uniref:Uncharacterized protein n=1 Tax=Methanococcus maripaludis (strain DSM 14266 / JCM 13030 / NBRC 101832 / S2 / LL) TaxID=267377 RepID=Q6LZZ4_METMP|nr:hypothetical protein [Methanococcus maripaludis]CAF30035.1 hypothetical protein MMP0479 [Methanococcus maripaludis S2]